jgi:glutathione S-transferase
MRQVFLADGSCADAKLAEVALRLDQLETLIAGPWAIGLQFTLADCSLAPTILYMTILLPLLGMRRFFDRHTRLARWWELINHRPTTKKVLDQERKALLDILSG